MAAAGIRGRTMEKTEYAAARASALARMLTGSREATPDQLSKLVCGLLDAAGLTPEQRLEVLGGAFVSEAVRPHWLTAGAAVEAHDRLRGEDSELADAVEALAQVLLGRQETREEASHALAELDRMFGTQSETVASKPASQPGLFEV